MYSSNRKETSQHQVHTGHFGYDCHLICHHDNESLSVSKVTATDVELDAHYVHIHVTLISEEMHNSTTSFQPS
jgi:hypothetical protein